MVSPRPVLSPHAPVLLATGLRRMVAVLAVTAALVAGVGVVPADAGARGRIDQESWLEWQVADAINGARQSPRSVDPHAGEPAVRALTGWGDLRDFARDWSDAMAERAAMSHNPAFAEGYCCWQKAGEVLAKLEVGDDVTRDDLAGIAGRAVRAWFGSPSHRSALLDGAYDQLGVGVTIDHAAGIVWVAVDFRQTTGETPPGGAWYRPGDAAPATPAGGWACDSTVAPWGAPAWPLPASHLRRLAGDDRVATALALASAFDAPRTVLLASARTPTDALAAAGLAGTLDAPVLLTAPGALDGRVADQLRRWRPDEVVLLGGTQALGDRVARQAGQAAPSATVDRLSGRDRFATAASVAGRLADRGGDPGRVVLALGAHPDPTRAWADAVSVSGLAASHEHPVLLTAPTELPPATRDALQSLSPDHVVVPGGASGVSDGVVQQVRELVPGARVDRVAGADRYETSRAVLALDQSLRSSPTRRVHVVDGETWPDALTAGPAAAASGGVVALVHGGRPDWTGSGMAHLSDLSNQLWRLDVTLVGGTAAISDLRAGAVHRELHCVS